LEAGGWVDAVRLYHPAPEVLFSWWSYRARDWQAGNRGRRLDHVWVTPDLAKKVQSVNIMREARGMVKPSDHVPVSVTFA
ncbi:MAG: endonuclease/exonuclease/phosphatase family protein, partial [Pseudomonadota bacterium]